MGVVDNLAKVLNEFATARVVAFADLSASMILASKGRESLTQENLDALCRQAKASFDDPLFGLSVQAFGDPLSAIVMVPDGVQVFLRSENEPADAICALCDPGIDLERFVTKLRETLDQVSGG